MKSNGCHKKEACIARKHLKKSGSEDKRLWRSEADVIKSTLIRSCSSEADHRSCSSEANVIRGSEEHQKLQKLEDSRIKSKAIWDRA